MALGGALLGAACTSDPLVDPASEPSLTAEEPQAPPPAAHLDLIDGRPVFRSERRTVALNLQVFLQLEQGEPLRVRVEDWASSDDGLTATVEAGPARVVLTATTSTPVVLRAEVRGAKATLVRGVGVELSLPSEGLEMVDRSSRWVSPEHPTDVGRFTPQLLRTSGIALIAQAQGLRVTPDEDRVKVRLVLDEAARRPLFLWSDCVEGAEDLPPKIDRGPQPIPSSMPWVAEVELIPDPGRLPVLSRIPAPYKAAIVFTDHADQSDVARLGALMYGQGRYSDPLEARRSGRGFAGRGLSMTKSVFPIRARGYPAQVDDPRYRSLLDELHRDGIEIGPHSVSGRTDTTQQTREGLALLAPYGPETWIDHQPNTNCEAITNRGLIEGPHAVREALEEQGYRYVWAGYDLDESGEHLNLLAPWDPGAIRPILHSHPLLGEDLQVFHSLWRSMSKARFLRAFRVEALDRLAEERGLHIAHTYLDTHRTAGPTAAWTLLDQVPGGFDLSPEADALFAELQQRQERGEIRVGSLREIGGHMLLVDKVKLTVDHGALILSSEQPIPSLGLFLPDDRTELLLDGERLEGARGMVSLDLPAGELRLDIVQRSPEARP